MSAEEMKNELEVFVNRGLSEGWGGWPTKNLAPRGGMSGGIGYATIPAGDLLPDVGKGPLGRAGAFASMRTTRIGRLHSAGEYGFSGLS